MIRGAIITFGSKVPQFPFSSCPVSSMRLLSWNVNGFRAVTKALNVQDLRRNMASGTILALPSGASIAAGPTPDRDDDTIGAPSVLDDRIPTPTPCQTRLTPLEAAEEAEAGGLRDLLRDVDVACFQEMKLTRRTPTRALLSPHGMLAFVATGERAGYAGVATFALPGSVASAAVGGSQVPDAGSHGLLDREGRVCRTDHGHFLLYNLYCPNAGRGPDVLRYKLRFLAGLRSVWERDLRTGREIVVCGDLNVAHTPLDIYNPKVGLTDSVR